MASWGQIGQVLSPLVGQKHSKTGFRCLTVAFTAMLDSAAFRRRYGGLALDELRSIRTPICVLGPHCIIVCHMHCSD